MSNDIIYSQDTFNNQVNGTVFYREGRLEDLPTAKTGIFESWKYDFEAGRQVFRATEEGRHGKIYEKRLVKDINGVPRWTGWMEIPSGEAHGIQAIAINDRPLQLPNSDGAIKLQITPETIDTYSRQEIYSLIENKIEENNDKSYEYVSWKKDDKGDWLPTAVQVLMATFPEGGQLSKFYLVEPRPGVDSPSNTATYFIWDELNGSQGWVPVDAPDLSAFITYAAFQGHVEETENSLSEIKSNLEDHLNDVGEETSVHISIEERERWNNSFNNITSLPEGPERYVVSDGTYSKAFEQVSFDGTIEEFEVSMPSSFIGKSGDVLKTGLYSEISSILAAGNDIVDMKLSISTLSTSGTKIKFQTDSGLESPLYTSAAHVTPWDINFSSSSLFDSILVLAEDESKKIQFNNIKLTISYRKPESVEIGDGEKNLPLNLVGPEGVLPTYNNLPLNKVLAPSVEWGNITGTVGLQKDLVLKIADLVAGKVNSADLSSVLRWDVYQNTVLPSLLQQEGTVVGEEIIPVGDSSHIIYEANSPIVSDIQTTITTLQESGKSPFNYKLSIDFISSGDNAVYFETDNPAIPPSPAVKSGPFIFNWPGQTTATFDKIYLRSTSGENVEYMDDIKLTISHVTFGDTIKVESGKKWKQDATEYDLSADKATVESPDISLGKNAKEYGEDGDVIKVFGEDIDSRYAGKKNFESLRQDLQTEFDERLAEDNALRTRIESIEEDFQAEVSERLSNDETIQAKVDSIEQSLQTETEERLAEDEATQSKLDELEQEISTVAETANKIGLNYDLIISSNEEFRTFIEDGTFTQSRRILFRHINEDYVYDTDLNESLDFSEIRYIKGEEPTEVLFTNMSAVHFENTIVEGARIKFRDFGETGYVYLNPWSKAIKSITLDKPEVTIEVDKYFDIYKLKLEVDCAVTLSGVETGRDYTLYVDQGKEVKLFSLTNSLQNRKDLNAGLKNNIKVDPYAAISKNHTVKSNTRTVIHACGANDKNEKDGLIIKEVIPCVEYLLTTGRDIVVGNIDGTIFGTNTKDKAVYVKNMSKGAVYARENVGETVYIQARFENGDGRAGKATGWVDASDGKTWALIEKENNNNVLASGVMADLAGDGFAFEIPDGPGNITLEFRVEPQMIAVLLDSDFSEGGEHADKVSSTSGFTTDGNNILYQVHYSQIDTEIIMVDDPDTSTGYFIHTQLNNVGMETTGSYRWKFKINDLPDPLVYHTVNGKQYPAIVITPKYYKRIYEATAKVQSNAGEAFDFEGVLVFFDDPSKSNNIIFQTVPARPIADEPIWLAYPHSGVSVKGNKVRITDPSLIGQTLDFEIVTASGLSIPWPAKIVKACPGKIVIEDSFKTESIGDGVGDSIKYVHYIGKSPRVNEPVDYNVHVEWSDPNGGPSKGKWEIVGGSEIATIHQDGSDKATITAISKGKVVVRFITSTGTIEQEVVIWVHVAAGEIRKLPVEGNRLSSYPNPFDLRWFDCDESDSLSHIPENDPRRIPMGQDNGLALPERDIPEDDPRRQLEIPNPDYDEEDETSTEFIPNPEYISLPPFVGVYDEETNPSGLFAYIPDLPEYVDHQISESVLSDSSGSWSLAEGSQYASIDKDTGKLVVSNIPDSEDPNVEPYINLIIEYVSNDITFDTKEKVRSQLPIQIYRGFQKLTFNKATEDTQFIGASISPQGEGQSISSYLLVQSGTEVIVQLSFEDGYTASMETINEFSTKLHATLVGEPTSKMAKFKFKMAFKDVTINVSSKKI